MGNFNLGPLSEWELVDGNVVLPGQPGQVQLHRFELMSTDDVWVFAADDLYGEVVLVCAARGHSRVKFTARGFVGLSFRCNGDVYFKRPHRVPQLRAESDLPSFTTLEPRGSRPADDLARMMMLVQLNNQRREAALRGELDRLSARVRQAESKPATAAAAPSAAAPAADPVDPQA